MVWRFRGCLKRVETASIQQSNGRVLYRRGKGWVDSRLLNKKNIQADRKIRIGSKEYRQLTDRLAKENRQGELAKKGKLYLEVDGKTMMVY